MQLDSLKELTDSIKRGERVILFPPGMLSVISLVFSLLISSISLSSSLINLIFIDSSFETLAIIQFPTLGIVTLFAVLPNLMILSGKKKYSTISYYYALVLIFISSSTLLAGFLQIIIINNVIYALFISLTLSIASIIIYHSASYLLVKEFFYLLKNPEAN